MATSRAQKAETGFCTNCFVIEAGPKHGLCDSCLSQAVIVVGVDGKEIVAYGPQPHQSPFHSSNAPNLLALGTRGTGKSKQMRWDIIIRCMLFPGFKALLIRRKMPDLRKALSLSTEIPTPSGWTTMGELSPGDSVFAPDGTPTKVQWKSDARVDENGTYQITFDNGESIIASAGHKWVVSTRMRRALGTHQVLTTQEIAQKVRVENDQRSNYAVRRTLAWQTPAIKLPIDPYVLGAWLGDRTKGQGAITSYDQEVVEQLRQAGYTVIERPAHPKEWSVRGLMTQLRSLGVLHTKYVPEQYLFGSYEQRLSLLQGLMDTDGWSREDGHCAFAQTNERRPIADTVFRLAASLGLKPRWSERPVRLNGKDYGTAYEVSWSADVPVFRLTRKLKWLRPRGNDTTCWHYIVSCEQVADEVCQCISVEHESHQFLVGRACIPTHNSHLRFIDHECHLLGCAHYRETTHDVKFDNGSFIQFSHCEHMKDVEDYLSSEWDYIGFDELASFPLEMFLQISSAAREGTDKPYKSLVRACSNPLGLGAGWMKQWFIDKNVNLGDYPDYCPDDFEMQFSTLDMNRYVNRKDYEKRLRNLPEHVRRAHLYGEFVIEGAYFTDFRRLADDGKPWHVIKVLPLWKDKPLQTLDWVSVYRAVDWGYFPDPWVCLWIFVLPNKRAIVFKERHNKRMLAADVAKQIKRESSGMHVVETFCDPTMFIKDGSASFSIAETFEMNGVPLTPAQNDRELYGYSIHEYLNTLIDGAPQLAIVESACPELVRTLPMMQMDSTDSRKLADGDDHWVVSLAYFCMGRANPTTEPGITTMKRWMRPVAKRR